MKRRIIFVKLIHHVHFLGGNLLLNLHQIRSKGTICKIFRLLILIHTSDKKFMSLFILHRNTTSENDGSIKQPNYLNYGYTRPGESYSILKKMKSGNKNWSLFLKVKNEK